MKKLFFILSVSVLFFACSGAPERGDYIPQSSEGVVSVNMKGIVDEIKWDMLFGDADLHLKDFGKNKFLKKLMEDPGKSGVDFMDRAFVFFDSVQGQHISVTILPLSDASSFGEFLSLQGDTVVAEGDLQVAKNGKVSVLWNDETAFVVSGKSEVKNAAAYVNQLLEGVSNGLFTSEFKGKELLKGNDHISFWCVFENKKAQLTGIVNFKNGKLEGSTDMYFDNKSEVLKMFQEKSQLKTMAVGSDVNKALLSLGITSSSQQISTFLEKNHLEDYLNYLLLQVHIDYDSFSPLFGGDIFVDFNGMYSQIEDKEVPGMNEETGEYEMEMSKVKVYRPDLIAVLSSADTSMMKMMVTRKLYDFSAVNNQGISTFGTGKGFLFFKGSNVFFNSDSATTQAIVQGKTVAENKDLDDAVFYFSLRPEKITKQLPLREFLPIAPVEAEVLLKQLENNVSNMKIVVNSAKGNTVHGSFEMNTNNKDENVLLTLIKMYKAFNSPVPGV